MGTHISLVALLLATLAASSCRIDREFPPRSSAFLASDEVETRHLVVRDWCADFSGLRSKFEGAELGFLYEELSLANHANPILYSYFGAKLVGDRIVGVTTFWPPNAEGVRQRGGSPRFFFVYARGEPLRLFEQICIQQQISDETVSARYSSAVFSFFSAVSGDQCTAWASDYFDWHGFGYVEDPRAEVMSRVRRFAELVEPPMPFRPHDEEHFDG